MMKIAIFWVIISLIFMPIWELIILLIIIYLRNCFFLRLILTISINFLHDIIYNLINFLLCLIINKSFVKTFEYLEFYLASNAFVAEVTNFAWCFSNFLWLKWWQVLPSEIVDCDSTVNHFLLSNELLLKLWRLDLILIYF